MLLAQDRSRFCLPGHGRAYTSAATLRVWHESLSDRMKSETNFTGHQTGYHRRDGRLKRRRRSLHGCECEDGHRTGGFEPSFGERDMTDVPRGSVPSGRIHPFRLLSKRVASWRAERRYGKPRVSQLVCGTLTS